MLGTWSISPEFSETRLIYKFILDFLLFKSNIFGAKILLVSIFSTTILFCESPDLLVLDETDSDKSYELCWISSIPFNLCVDTFLFSSTSWRTPFSFRLMRDTESFGVAETAEKGRTVSNPVLTFIWVAII